MDRKALAAKEAATEKFTLAEGEMRRKAGHAIFAGPQGSGTYAVGGKKIDNVEKMRLLQVPPAIIR